MEEVGANGMADIDPQTLIRSRAGARVSGMLPYVEAEIAQMAKALDNRMFAAAANGELTSEMAMAGWMERWACQKLLKHFQTIVRMGTGEGL